jgi:hypothetical protein
LSSKAIWEIGAFRDTALNKEAFAILQANRYIRYDDLPLVTRDGKVISVEFVSNVYECAGIDVIQCNIRDNTARHLAEGRLRQKARDLRVISEGNSALLTSRTEAELFARICEVVVGIGGYRMAWIGVADPGPDKAVFVLGHYGDRDNYLGTVTFTWADDRHGSSPTGRAIRSGEPQFDDFYRPEQTTSIARAEAARRGYEACLALPISIVGSPILCLTIYSASSRCWTDGERLLLRELASDLGFGISTLRAAVRSRHHERRVRESLEQAIYSIARTVEARDSYTAGHEARVAALCRRLATDLGLPAEQIHGLSLAASIHDLGKIGLPAEILGKPRKLTPLEFALVKEHSKIGADIVRGIEFPWPIAAIIEQHHERIDGSGYPQGLKGEDILLEAKILAVADVVEAMASHRPYRAALGIDAALAEIKAQSGVTLDSRVVDACLVAFRDGGYDIEAEARATATLQAGGS